MRVSPSMWPRGPRSIGYGRVVCFGAIGGMSGTWLVERQMERGISFSFFLSLSSLLPLPATEEIKRMIMTKFRLSFRNGFCSIILHNVTVKAFFGKALASTFLVEREVERLILSTEEKKVKA